jgi:hypothetical protein
LRRAGTGDGEEQEEEACLGGFGFWSLLLNRANCAIWEWCERPRAARSCPVLSVPRPLCGAKTRQSGVPHTAKLAHSRIFTGKKADGWRLCKPELQWPHERSIFVHQDRSDPDAGLIIDDSADARIRPSGLRACHPEPESAEPE